MTYRLKNINYLSIIYLGNLFVLLTLLTVFSSCSTGNTEASIEEEKEEDTPENNAVDNVVDSEIANTVNIDLTNWKVTLPIPRSDGKPLEVKPPEILDYATNETLLKFMYNDSTDGSLVFYTYPESSTANSSYSRTELRELMDGESSSVNWTFEQGGKIKGTLAMDTISKDSSGDFHRTIIMQIHGRLTNEQRDLIGQADNNAPPVLKIYWVDGKVRVKTKELKNVTVSDTEILHEDAWTDDEGYSFPEEVGFNTKFTLEVIASGGRMEVVMNGKSVVYEGIHMEKWGVFENYFKAGNYLITTDKDAFAKVKYYELEASHN